MPAVPRIPGERAIRRDNVRIGELPNNPQEIGDRQVRRQQDTRVFGERVGGRVPPFLPRQPSFVQQAHVFGVMRDEDPTKIGRARQDLDVRESQMTKFLGRLSVVIDGAKRPSQRVRNILVKCQRRRIYASAAALASRSASIAPR